MNVCLKKMCALFFLSTIIGMTKAQDNPTLVRQENSNVTISVDRLLGKWYSADTINTFIEFVENGEHSIEMEGYRPGVGKYAFIRTNDSIQANGTAANWPPYDCTLQLKDDSTLVVKFYQYHYETTRNVVFHRKE